MALRQFSHAWDACIACIISAHAPLQQIDEMLQCPRLTLSTLLSMQRWLSHLPSSSPPSLPPPSWLALATPLTALPPLPPSHSRPSMPPAAPGTRPGPLPPGHIITMTSIVR